MKETTRLLRILIGCLVMLSLRSVAHGQAGTLDTSFGDPNVSDGSVGCVAVDGTGKMVIAGSFTMVGGETHNRLARLNANGIVDTMFAPNVDGGVSALGLQTDGKILIGGNFTHVNGTLRRYVARLNADGSLDGSYNPNGSGQVFAMVIQPDGKPILSGEFFSMGGVAVNGLTRLNLDGTVDTTFTSGQVLNQAQGLALQGDGGILTVARNQTIVERLKPTGVRDTAFNIGNTCLGEQCITTQADGKILVYTEQDSFNAFLRRYNADGTPDPTFAAGVIQKSGTNASIFSISVQLDGKIIIGGTFTTVDGVGRNGMARFSATGVLDPTYNPNVNGTAFGMGSPDGKFMVSGTFSTVGGVTRHNLARLNADTGTRSIRVPDAGTIIFMRSGALVEVQDVIFESSSDGGTSWTPQGAASRIANGWTITGVALPRHGLVRARSRIAGSVDGRCSTLEDFSQSYALPDFGTLSLNPPAPVGPGMTLAANFSGWQDGSGGLALTYQVLVDGVSQGPPTSNSPIIFTGPSADGPHTLTGRITDSTGATTSVSQTFNVDATPPQLVSVHLVSSNADPHWAAVGNSVTLTFQTNEPIAPPTVLIHGIPVIATTSGGNIWQGVVQVTKNRVEGMIGVSIQYSDLVGNAGVTGTATTDGTSVILDRTPPVISLNGASPFIVEAGGQYVEPGATALDALAGDVSGTIVITGTVNASVPGFYFLTYTAKDPAGNSGSTVRTVVVMDTTPPSIAAPAGGFTPLTLVAGSNGTAALPDYTAQPITGDNVAVTGVTQSPLAGTPLAPGPTVVTLTASDSSKNTNSVAFSVTVGDLTPPTIQTPAVGFIPAAITTGVDATALLPDYTGQPVVGDNVAVASVTQNPAPGSPQIAGTTTVTLTVHDSSGNTADLVFDVGVADGTKPEIAAPPTGFTPLEITADPDGMVALGDYTGQAITSDNVGVTSVTQVPPAGESRLFGRTTVTLTAHDDAGNTRDLSFEIVVRLAGPVLNALAMTGGAVPGAGLDPRIPADATFTRVGFPAVSDHRALTFIGKWQTTTGVDSGIFVGDSSALLVKTGEDAPGIPGAKFKVLQDPQLAPDGSVAFRATVQGSGITPASDEGVWMSANGALALVLREGAQITGLPDKFRLKSIAGLSYRNGELLAKAQLADVAKLITAASDVVLLRVTQSGATALARKGDLIDLADGFPASAIQSIGALIPAPGSPAQGRWHGDGNAIAKLNLENGRSVILGLAADGSATRSLAVGDGVPNLPASVVWSALSLPAIEPGGQGAVVRGTLAAIALPGVPPIVTHLNDDLLAFSPDPNTPFSMFAREGSAAPGAGNAAFSTFLDPLVNGAGRVAFSATLGGAGVSVDNNTGIWWGQPDALTLLARTNAPVPGPDGAPTAAKWNRFVSLALPSGPNAGPVFVAQIRGSGVTLKNNLGVWGVDTTGLLRQLLRTGDLVDGQPIIDIQCLRSAPGAQGASRGFNARGTIAARVLFARGGQAVVRIDIPEGKTRLTDFAD